MLIIPRSTPITGEILELLFYSSPTLLTAELHICERINKTIHLLIKQSIFCTSRTQDDIVLGRGQCIHFCTEYKYLGF